MSGSHFKVPACCSNSVKVQLVTDHCFQEVQECSSKQQSKTPLHQIFLCFYTYIGDEIAYFQVLICYISSSQLGRYGTVTDITWGPRLHSQLQINYHYDSKLLASFSVLHQEVGEIYTWTSIQLLDLSHSMATLNVHCWPVQIEKNYFSNWSFNNAAYAVLKSFKLVFDLIDLSQPKENYDTSKSHKSGLVYPGFLVIELI